MFRQKLTKVTFYCCEKRETNHTQKHSNTENQFVNMDTICLWAWMSVLYLWVLTVPVWLTGTCWCIDFPLSDRLSHTWACLYFYWTCKQHICRVCSHECIFWGPKAVAQQNNPCPLETCETQAVIIRVGACREGRNLYIPVNYSLSCCH